MISCFPPGLRAVKYHVPDRGRNLGIQFEAARKNGPGMLGVGGMNKVALCADKAAVDAEIERMRRLAASRALSCPDHRFMPGTKFALASIRNQKYEYKRRVPTQRALWERQMATYFARCRGGKACRMAYRRTMRYPPIAAGGDRQVPGKCYQREVPAVWRRRIPARRAGSDSRLPGGVQP